MKFYPFISEDQISVVYNGVSNEYSILKITDLVSFKNLVPFESKNYALYIGDRSSLYKNFKLAVEACAIGKCPIVIVGGGLLSPDEKKWITSVLGGDMFVQFTGLTNEKLNILYNNALVCFTHLYMRGLGFQLLKLRELAVQYFYTIFINS